MEKEKSGWIFSPSGHTLAFKSTTRSQSAQWERQTLRILRVTCIISWNVGVYNWNRRNGSRSVALWPFSLLGKFHGNPCSLTTLMSFNGSLTVLINAISRFTRHAFENLFLKARACIALIVKNNYTSRHTCVHPRPWRGGFELSLYGYFNSKSRTGYMQREHNVKRSKERIPVLFLKKDEGRGRTSRAPVSSRYPIITRICKLQPHIST